MPAPLKPGQRHVAEAVIVRICRGEYADALSTLKSTEYTPVALPTLQQSLLKEIIVRLQSPQGRMPKLKPLSEAVIEELRLKELDKSVLSKLDTQIPSNVLVKIYQQAVSMSFEHFHKYLQHMQWVEHTIIQHMLILYAHCLKLKMAQQAMKRVHLLTGVSMELTTLYCLIFGLSVYLLSFLY